MHRPVRNIISFLLLSALFLNGGYSRPSSPRPHLYPKIERYFHSLENNPIDTSHIKVLSALRASIKWSLSVHQKLTVLFICPDNSFRSQAAQVMLESLAEINHITALKVFSAGYEEKDVDPRLLKLLVKKGFLLSNPSLTEEKKNRWLVKFSDEMAPVSLYAKSYNDSSVPTSIYLLIKMCSMEEPVCTDIRGALFVSEWPLENTTRIQDEMKLEKEFDLIATEIYTTMTAAVDANRPLQMSSQ